MNCQKISAFITKWMLEKLEISKQKGFITGISGGIDSAVTSSLAVLTKKPVILLNMPIFQPKNQFDRAEEQIKLLKQNNNNIESYTINLTETYKELKSTLPTSAQEELALVNTRARLRMTSLYAFANSYNYLVCGTGNKIEDFGIGFFTKYGDGAVDISPIADLMKSEVYKLAEYLTVPESILNAAPTDGLWENDRTDEDQIGASYDELEWAMNFCKGNEHLINTKQLTNLSPRQKQVLDIYLTRHFSSKHKMEMPPVCLIPEKERK